MSLTTMTIDWTKDNALVNKAASLASRTNDKVYGLVASLMFAIGAHDKEEKANVLRDVKPVFLAFASKHWSEAAGRKPLTAKSSDGYASSFAAFAEAGFHPGYDATSIADFAVDTLKGSFAKRGATLRAILKAHPTTPPTADDLAKFVKGKAADTAHKAAEALGEDFNDKFGTDGDFPVPATNAPWRLAYLDLQVAIAAFIAATPADAVEVQDVEKERAALRAELNKA